MNHRSWFASLAALFFKPKAPAGPTADLRLPTVVEYWRMIHEHQLKFGVSSSRAEEEMRLLRLSTYERNMAERRAEIKEFLENIDNLKATMNARSGESC